jgi:hypothetical protein
MIKLHAKDNYSIAPIISHKLPFLAKVTTNSDFIQPLRNKYVFIWNPLIKEIPEGFLLILVPLDAENVTNELKTHENVLFISKDLDYLTDDDVIKFYPENNFIDVLYRRSANNNAFLVTERCNSFCIANAT